MPPVNLSDAIGASHQQRSILDLLIKAYPRTVRGSAVVDALYAADPNGGAEFARTIVSIQMHRLRKRMAGSGWTIPKLGGGKGNVAFYQVTRVQS
jgi:hypothetical protein